MHPVCAKKKYFLRYMYTQLNRQNFNALLNIIFIYLSMNDAIG